MMYKVAKYVRYEKSMSVPPVFVRVPMPEARSSFDGVAIRYALPVLYMTSCLHNVPAYPYIDIDTKR